MAGTTDVNRYIIPLIILLIGYLIDEKKKLVKSDQFFSGDQYFSPINNFTGLNLTPTKNFYQLVFLLNKNQITEILKRLPDLLYHNLVEWRWAGKGS